MEVMQLIAIIMMALLTMKLLLLPERAVANTIVNRSRWLMAGGTALICIQFLLQYMLHLRAYGVERAVMLNLAMFIPASALLSLAMLLLLKQRHISRIEKYIGPLTWSVAMILITLGAWSGWLFWTEVAASVCYAAMQLYYTVRQIHYLRNIRNALDNYYDSDMDGLLNWMQYSIIILALMAAAIPAMIFGHGWWLALFAIFCFIGIFYLGDNFCHYAVSTVYTVEEVKSEKSNSDTLDTVIPAPEGTQEGISQQTMDRVTHAVEKWIAKGGHLKSRLYQPVAASEIGVPKYLLAGWLSQQGLKYNDWLSNLRIEEAKRLIQEHPGWNNDTIAQECGFTDRSQFQKKFKERVKCSPTEFLAANSRKHL